MIKLTHRLSYFSGLANHNPRYYGFNTMQAAFDPFTPGNSDDVCGWVSGVDNDLDTLLTFAPQETNALFLGMSLPDEWYHAYRNGLLFIKKKLGGRVVGTRINHEYRPSTFPPDTAWVNWIRQRSGALYTYICLYQKTKWLQLLADTKGLIHPVNFLERTTNTPYDGPAWTDFRTVFNLWCQYQCQREAVVINRLAEISMGLGLPFYLYPGGKSSYWSPRVLPQYEYTVEHTITNPDTVILEAGSWNTRDQRWLDGVTATISQPFIWTNQLDLNSLAIANPEQEYRWRMDSLDVAGNRAQGYGLWSGWNPTAQPEYQSAMQDYMDRLRVVLL